MVKWSQKLIQRIESLVVYHRGRFVFDMFSMAIFEIRQVYNELTMAINSTLQRFVDEKVNLN